MWERDKGESELRRQSSAYMCPAPILPVVLLLLLYIYYEKNERAVASPAHKAKTARQIFPLCKAGLSKL